MMMKFATLSLVAIILVATTSANKTLPDSTKCDRSEFETCSLKLTMIGDDQFKFPVNADQMAARCRGIKSLEQCAKDHTKECFEIGTRRPISVLLYSITKTNRGYCRTGKRRKAFVRFGKCANRNRDALNGFMTELNRDLHAIRQYKQTKMVVPLVCCNYFQFKTQIIGLFNDQCPEHVPEVEHLLDGYVGDILNVGCGDYSDDNDLCDSVIELTPNWTEPLQHRDFILPLANIIEKLNGKQ